MDTAPAIADPNVREDLSYKHLIKSRWVCPGCGKLHDLVTSPRLSDAEAGELGKRFRFTSPLTCMTCRAEGSIRSRPRRPHRRGIRAADVEALIERLRTKPQEPRNNTKIACLQEVLAGRRGDERVQESEFRADPMFALLEGFLADLLAIGDSSGSPDALYDCGHIYVGMELTPAESVHFAGAAPGDTIFRLVDRVSQGDFGRHGTYEDGAIDEADRGWVNTYSPAQWSRLAIDSGEGRVSGLFDLATASRPAYVDGNDPRSEIPYRTFTVEVLSILRPGRKTHTTIVGRSGFGSARDFHHS